MFFRLLKGPVVPVLRMSVRSLRLKTIKLITGLIENLENFSRLSDFKYIFRSSNLTADLLTVAISRAFKISGARDLSDDVICSIVISADDTTLHCMHDQVSDLLHRPGLAFQLISDI